MTNWNRKIDLIKIRLTAGNLPYYWLVFIITIFYAGIIGFGFSPLDDPSLIIDKIEWLRNPFHLITLFTQEYQVNLYRPVLIISFMIDALIGKGNPAVFHTTNLLLHMTSTLFLYHLLRLLLKSNKRPFILSVIFAVHPALIHSVAWIPGRNDILLAIMMLVITINFIQFIRTNMRKYLILHVVFFSLALFTKESALLIPVVILVISIVIYRDQLLKIAKILSPFYIIIITIWVICKLNIGRIDLPSYPEFDIISIQQLIILFLSSLGKSFLPIQLSIIPYYSALPVIYLVISAMIFFLLMVNKKVVSEWAIVGIVWFIAFLLPGGLWSILIIKDNIFYEHRLYLPFIGLFIMFNKIPIKSFIMKRVTVWYLILFVSVAIILNRGRLKYYASDRVFADRCIVESPTCSKSFIIRGELSIRNGQYQPGLIDLKRSIRLNKHNYHIYNRIGFLYESMGYPDSALISYATAIDSDPKQPEGYYNIGNILLGVKNYREAIRYYTSSIEADSLFVPSFHNRAVAYYCLAEYQHAKRDLAIVKKFGYPVQPVFYQAIEKPKMENK